ncbi:MAG TPA: hypothetical protein VGC95_10135 [Chitinophagaceae bacterium]
MKKLYFISFAILSIWLAACKSASKLYDKGNYDEAVQVAAKKLQKDPNDAKLRSVLQDSYKYAVTDHQNKINNLEAGNDELKNEWIYNEYASLQDLYNAIFRTPAVYQSVRPKDYSRELNDYAMRAADVHYQKGMSWMSNHDRQSAKTAYREFQAATRFDPNNSKIRQALNDAYLDALTQVVVVPANDYGFTYSSYNYQLQNYQNDIIRILQSNSGNEFVKFFSAADAQRLNIQPDEIIETHFSAINLGRIKENYQTREISKDVVVKEIVYKPDSVVKQYAKVRAKIVTTQRTLYSEGNLAIVAHDPQGRVIWNDNVVGSESWSGEYSTFNGDERALGEDEKKLTSRTHDNPPRDEDVMSCLKDRIYTDFISRLRTHYSTY